ncbi:short-chain dehydrogenase [Lysinibacillus sp. KU-BSD001]|uniref:short-chain dehydrogenase n=1 Tax=Lysinibacillus sp. KU-BSD001 TaxID=3141328 RepID=UPI0036DFEC4E
MSLFVWGSIVVIIILCALSAYATVVAANQIEKSNSELDTSVDPVIRRHPFLLNPIIMMYIVVGIFMTIVLFFYWARGE